MGPSVGSGRLSCVIGRPLKSNTLGHRILRLGGGSKDGKTEGEIKKIIDGSIKLVEIIKVVVEMIKVFEVIKVVEVIKV